MISLTWFSKSNNSIFDFLSVRLPGQWVLLKIAYLDIPHEGGSIMDRYFESYREMISLRGLTGHTLKGYCTYIRAYLDYLQRILCKRPEDVSWQEMWAFIQWLQKERSLADRTVNCAISQLRFFTLYVLHQPWDCTQLSDKGFYLISAYRQCCLYADKDKGGYDR